MYSFVNVQNLCTLKFYSFISFTTKNLTRYEPYCDINRVDHDKVVVTSKGGLFGWLVSSFEIKDDEIESKRGLDAVMYLYVTKYLFFIVLGYGFYGWCILFPVHATASGVGLTGTAMLSELNTITIFIY